MNKKGFPYYIIELEKIQWNWDIFQKKNSKKARWILVEIRIQWEKLSRVTKNKKLRTLSSSVFCAMQEQKLPALLKSIQLLLKF